MLFSVVIPTYNRLDLLRRCVDSVIRQTFKDFEIVIVDDGSTDGTEVAARQLGDNITFLRQSNQGPGAARNLGSRHASGDYIAFLDSDDLWFPWTLQTYAYTIAKHQSPAFIAGKSSLFSEPQELSQIAETPTVSLPFADYLASGDEWRWWGVSSFVVKRSEFSKTSGFTERNINGEDADLALKLGCAPGFVQVKAPATFGYLQHDNNVTKVLAKTVAGAWLKIESETNGTYPGGNQRKNERINILTRHVRPVSIACMKAGLFSDGWRLYRACLRWHLRLHRWKYLIGFPLKRLLPTSKSNPT